jgi:hypothetical protein
MIKHIYLLFFILLVPAYSLCQAGLSGELKGTIIIERKPVEFTWISTPDGTTEIPCFTYLPGKDDYFSGKGKQLLPLQSINTIEISRLSAKETIFVRDSCFGCSLYKAVISFKGQPENTERFVYLALKYFTWKNTGSAEFYEPRMVELRYVNAIKMNEVIKRN